RQKECIQMPGRMARSDPRPSVRVTRELVAVSTSRLSCKSAGKTRTLMPVWDSPGESRFLSWSLLPAPLVNPLLRLENWLEPFLAPLMAFRLLGVIEKVDFSAD